MKAGTLETGDIGSELDALERDVTLDEPDRLNEREEAIHLLAYLDDLLASPSQEAVTRAALRMRMDALGSRLEAATARLVANVQEQTRAGHLRGASLRALLDRYTAYRPEGPRFLHLNYEPVDILVGGVFALDRPIEESVPRSRDMVHLEFSPTSIVLEIVDRLSLGPGDLFVDLGAGLGQVAMLVHMLTGVRARGIEMQPTYVAAARDTAREFGLRGVEFLVADARAADYGEGTAWYLFTPFHGEILQAVLARLREQSHRKELRICTYGPTTIEVSRCAWLRSVDGGLPHTSCLGLFAPR